DLETLGCQIDSPKPFRLTRVGSRPCGDRLGPSWMIIESGCADCIVVLGQAQIKAGGKGAEDGENGGNATRAPAASAMHGIPGARRVPTERHGWAWRACATHHHRRKRASASQALSP